MTHLSLGRLIGGLTTEPRLMALPAFVPPAKLWLPVAFKRLPLSFCLLLALFVFFSSGCSSQTGSSDNALPANATVTRVVDGDTVEVQMGRSTEKLRLIGVDTPETVHPSQAVGCFGKEASEFTKATLPKGTSVQLVLDVEDRDVYGRLLAYVYRSSDGLFVNAELVSRGYAQVLTIPPNVAHADEFADLGAQARSANNGLWGACKNQ